MARLHLKSDKLTGNNSHFRRGEWEAADLVRRVCHALDIAKETINTLAAEGYTNPDSPKDKILPEKVIGETALLLLVTSMAGDHDAIKERTTQLAGMLIPYARSKKMFLEICLQPALALEYAQAHVFLTKIGFPDRQFDELLQKSIAASAHFGRERPPNRMLEQEWIKKIWNNGMAGGEGHVAKVVSYSALENPVDLLHGTKDDLYSYTHALIYATGFNLFEKYIVNERELLLDKAEAMLARCLDEQDYDLAGEVLLSWPLTGTTWSPAAVFAFKVLTRVEDEAGFLPTPSTRISTLNELTGEERKKYLYATAYHTAYVMGLLCSAALQPDRIPPKSIEAGNFPSDALHQIRPYLETSSDKHWQDDFSRLTEAEQNALSGFLLNVALFRHVQQKEYAKVYELLNIAYENGLAETSLAIQCAELLDRLSLLSTYK